MVRYITKRNVIWLMLGITLVLTACTGTDERSVTEPPATDNNPAETHLPVQPETSVEVDDNYGVGNSPEHLKIVAAGWETDWSLHTIDYDEVISGGVFRDVIRSLDEPNTISLSEASAWLADTEPVIAVEINNSARAYPLSILTRHEIANDILGSVPIAVTFCPLCNSALVFEREVNGKVYEFGVSGLLHNSDLIMYDRTTESLWQQFTGEGIVGVHAGGQLAFLPSSIVSYGDFKSAYPDDSVLSNNGRDYGINPYANYDQTTGRPFLFTGELDSRLVPMMRVVGVTVDGEAVAYPYDVLAEVNVVHDTVSGQGIVIFYKLGTNSALGSTAIAEAEDVGAAAVYSPIVNGESLQFTFDGEYFIDDSTQSKWNLIGQAVEGELAGTALTPLVHSDHFWFSWAAFYPETTIYAVE